MDQDLLAYLEQRFASMDRRFDEVGRRIDKVDRRLDGLETEVRGAWIAIEDLRGQVKLVAEGVANNNERLERHGEEVSQRFDDLESLIHHSYDDLDERVSRLEAAG